jgi:dienelactone hydrolase
MIHVQKFSISTDGFYGALHRPEQDGYPGKALILFSGSDGKFRLTSRLAELFCVNGITTMALAYWNVPGLPEEFRELPVDTLEKASLWLRNNGYEKIGLWGISKGGELALLAGSLMPELISCVVAVSPINAVCQGISKRRGIRTLPCSSWSWHGQYVPYTPLSLSKIKLLRDCWKGKEVTMTNIYRPVVEHPLPESVIQGV